MVIPEGYISDRSTINYKSVSFYLLFTDRSGLAAVSAPNAWPKKTVIGRQEQQERPDLKLEHHINLDK